MRSRSRASCLELTGAARDETRPSGPPVPAFDSQPSPSGAQRGSRPAPQGVRHLLQQGLERVCVWHLFHHFVEQVLDVGVNALRREDGLDDILRRLLAMVDRVASLARMQELGSVQIGLASPSVLAMTRSALIQRDPGGRGFVR